MTCSRIFARRGLDGQTRMNEALRKVAGLD